MEESSVDGESLGGEADRRCQYFCEREHTESTMRFHHAGNGSRNPGCARANHALACKLAVGSDVHVPRRRDRSGLTIIERRGAPVRHADDHESAAAEIASFWKS